MVGSETSSPWPARIATLFGAAVFLGGTTALLGWVLDIERLTDWGDKGVSIQPNAATCAALAGFSLVLLGVGRLRTAAVAGALIASLSALTLCEHLSGVNLGIDTLLM